MTTASTPSDVERLARFQKSMQTHLGASRGSCRHPEERQAWDDYERTVAVLRCLQTANERLLAQVHKLEMDALDLASENSILKRAETDELEARKPLPLSDWIDADERRPEAYLDVLVVIDGKWVTTGEWLHAQKTWCWEQTGDEPDESRVTHWMHMPPPPERGITGGSS